MEKSSTTMDLVNITQSVKNLAEAFVIAASNTGKESLLDTSYCRHLFKEYMRRVGIIRKPDTDKNIDKKEGGK